MRFQMNRFRLSSLLARRLTVVKDSTKKSIDLDPLELRPQVGGFRLWGPIATCHKFTQVVVSTKIQIFLIRKALILQKNIIFLNRKLMILHKTKYLLSEMQWFY